jgi:hypothetical protein
MNVKLDTLEEISKSQFESETVLSDLIVRVTDLLKSDSTFRRYLPKRCGVPVMILLKILCVMRVCSDSVMMAQRHLNYSLYSEHISKNGFYRFLGDSLFNWRMVLIRMALKFQAYLRARKMEDSKDVPRCYIVDDTTIRKTGVTMERVSKVHDHTDNSYQLGYKLLACAFFDGRSTMVADFSLLRESKKNKFGLSKTELARQHTKVRDENSPAYKRLQEADADKITLVTEMISRLWKNGIVGDYLLVDSWFPCDRLITCIRSIGKGSVHVIGRLKMGGKKYDVDGRKLNLNEMASLYESKAQYCKKYKCKYISHKAKMDGEDVKIFIVIVGRKKKTEAFMTTDMSLSFAKCFELYQIRWNIEVLFKECKQYLDLGGSQSTDFDAQIADATLCFLTHMALTMEKRLTDYETIGEMFYELRESLFERTLWMRNLKLFESIMADLADMFGLNMSEMMNGTNELTNPENKSKLIKITRVLLANLTETEIKSVLNH